MDLKKIGCVLNSFGSGKGPAKVSFEHFNGPSSFIKGGKFLDQLNEYQLMQRADIFGRVSKVL
jgi:hypothetical protein